MLLRLDLYYNDPVMLEGNGTDYTEIIIPRYSWKTIDYYKQFHCLNCKLLGGCKLRKQKPMKQPEQRFYTCSFFTPKEAIQEPKIIPDFPTKQKRLENLAWALEVIERT